MKKRIATPHPIRCSFCGRGQDEVARLLGVKPDRLFVSSRLDVGVSGVVLFAIDESSREALSRARQKSSMLNMP